MRKYGEFLETEFGKLKTNSSEIKANGVVMERETRSGIDEVWVKVEEINEIGRDAGNYATFYLNELTDKKMKTLVERLSLAIRKMCSIEPERVLFFGMGNNEIISDSLGSKTLEQLDMSEFAYKNQECKFAKFCPSVFAVSGFQSFEIVKSLSEIFKPDVVVVIDSLCAGSVARLGNSFQLTDAGITPGSAIGGSLAKISSETLGGVKVISIGVPVVIYLQSVIEEATQKLKPLEQSVPEVLDNFDGIFSPKDIDKIIDLSSEVIASAIKRAFI